MYLNYTNERLQELINIIDDIRVYELPIGFDDMTDIILILQTLLEKDVDNGT